jgi:phosphoglucomutase/phosphomannomutase
MNADTLSELEAARRGFGTLAVRPETREAALAHLARWLHEPAFEAYLPQIRSALARERWDLLLDSFYQVLPFGTGGRRGPVGVGPNRYNPWTLSASVQGHVTWMRETLPGQELHVVLAYDVRRFDDANGVYDASLPNPCLGLSSRDFAEIAAGVYAANGVHTTLLAPESTSWVSTPELSFAIRHLGAQGGLNISASHNPSDDNGGKFYNALGGQEVPPHDAVMAGHVARVADIRSMSYGEARAAGWARDLPADVHPAYVAANLATSLRPDARSARVVFTNLHGTGDTTVRDVLVAGGFRVDLEPTCAPHDPTFSQVPFRSPNPEVRPSMDRAVALATVLDADLVLATDPDADRIGLQARRADGTFRFFTGNEIATLVTEYRLAHGQWERPIVMKTEVTSEQVTRAARHHGAQVVGDLMVGFKYIGDGLRQLDATGSFAGVRGTVNDFVVGCEESHGVLVTAAMRDKDAAGAALALAEYASILKEDGRTLVDALADIWERDGYVHNELISTVMRGAAGKARIERIQSELRAHPPAQIGELPVTAVHDRADPNGPLGPIRSDTDAASRDVLVFEMGDTARILLRPSGTEPKNKIYVEYKGRPGSDPATEIPRCTAMARALARAFAQDMLGRVGITLPAWALRVSDLVAIEQKQALADTLLPTLQGRLADGSDPRAAELQAWLDAELKTFGKDPRKLVAEAIAAWCEDASAPEAARVAEAMR